jgi:hypothetical protein
MKKFAGFIAIILGVGGLINTYFSDYEPTENIFFCAIIRWTGNMGFNRRLEGREKIRFNINFEMKNQDSPNLGN